MSSANRSKPHSNVRGGYTASSLGVADESPEAVIGAHIAPQPDGCWLWTGPKDAAGYGRHGKYGYIHRFVFRTLVGKIPDGYIVHHLCEVKACCNPDHLGVMTNSAHMRLHANQRNVA